LLPDQVAASVLLVDAVVLLLVDAVVLLLVVVVVVHLRRRGAGWTVGIR